MRGLPPATFVMSPEDLIVARVRDIDDKVIHSIEQKEERERDYIALLRS